MGTKTNKYLRGIKQFVRDYLSPEFDKLDIREIRELQIRKLYHMLLEKKLSHKTIKHILSNLHTFLIDIEDEANLKVPKFPKFKAFLVKYMTSGDVSGDYDQVVGYAGIIVK